MAKPDKNPGPTPMQSDLVPFLIYSRRRAPEAASDILPYPSYHLVLPGESPRLLLGTPYILQFPGASGEMRPHLACRAHNCQHWILSRAPHGVHWSRLGKPDPAREDLDFKLGKPVLGVRYVGDHQDEKAGNEKADDGGHTMMRGTVQVLTSDRTFSTTDFLHWRMEPSVRVTADHRAGDGRVYHAWRHFTRDVHATALVTLGSARVIPVGNFCGAPVFLERLPLPGTRCSFSLTCPHCLDYRNLYRLFMQWDEENTYCIAERTPDGRWEGSADVPWLMELLGHVCSGSEPVAMGFIVLSPGTSPHAIQEGKARRGKQ